MKITSALLKPNLSEIEAGFNRLQVLLTEHDSDEALDLKDYIEKQLHQVQKSKMILFSLEIENNPASPFLTELFEDFRKLKLRIRFAERRWRLILSNIARSRRMRGGIEHVASAVA